MVTRHKIKTTNYKIICVNTNFFIYKNFFIPTELKDSTVITNVSSYLILSIPLHETIQYTIIAFT